MRTRSVLDVAGCGIRRIRCAGSVLVFCITDLCSQMKWWWRGRSSSIGICCMGSVRDGRGLYGVTGETEGCCSFVVLQEVRYGVVGKVYKRKMLIGY